MLIVVGVERVSLYTADTSLPMSDTPSTIVHLDGVTKDYLLGKQIVHVLRGLSFDLPRGTFTVLTGPSGSGKSTLLNLLGGLDRPTKGVLTVDGQELQKRSDRGMALYRQRTVGFVFQSFNLLPQLTAEQNVLLPVLLAGGEMEPATARARDLFDRVGLKDRARHRPLELSGGEQQRVALVRALINKPRLLLADEPTGNLDTGSGSEVIQMLSVLSRHEGVTLLVATHDERVSQRADRTLHLVDGQLQPSPA